MAELRFLRGDSDDAQKYQSDEYDYKYQPYVLAHYH
jgi:hypothetical protein